VTKIKKGKKRFSYIYNQNNHLAKIAEAQLISSVAGQFCGKIACHGNVCCRIEKLTSE